MWMLKTNYRYRYYIPSMNKREGGKHKSLVQQGEKEK